MEDLSYLSDNDLIIQARNGNNTAFTYLFYRYDKKVFSIAAQYFQSSDDAKDVYQEVFIRVYKGLKKFEFRSEFSTWLFRVATNVCLTHKAQYKKRQNVSISNDEDDESPKIDLKSSEQDEPDNKLLNTEMKGKIRDAIDTLSPKQKMVFKLKHIHDYKIKEIAQMMDCSEGTVKKYLFLATDKIRLKLKTI